MAVLSSDIIEQVGRTMVIALVPTLLIPAASLIFSLAQGMMGIREESFQYAVRVVALVGVIAVFGVSIGASLTELLRMALR
jgi:type III secretory pathway component EscS